MSSALTERELGEIEADIREMGGTSDAVQLRLVGEVKRLNELLLGADVSLVQALRTTLFHHLDCDKENDLQNDCSCWRSEAHSALARLKALGKGE